jgi:hypothetical protein
MLKITTVFIVFISYISIGCYSQKNEFYEEISDAFANGKRPLSMRNLQFTI